jgi:hypothetical protein
MEKITLLIICIFLNYSCNRENKGDKLLIENPKKESCFNIDCISYWGLQNGDSLPMSILKLDTILNIGLNVNFDEHGDTIEKIILVDKSKAYKIYYFNNKPYLSNMVYYKLKRNHPTKLSFSLTCYDYGFRNHSSDSFKNEISYVKNKALDGPNISFYNNMKVKSISYYRNGDLDGKKLTFDSSTSKIIKEENYKEGEKIK